MMDLIGKTGEADAFLEDVTKIKEARQEQRDHAAAQFSNND
jgi:hypothetical protein